MITIQCNIMQINAIPYDGVISLFLSPTHFASFPHQFSTFPLKMLLNFPNKLLYFPNKLLYGCSVKKSDFWAHFYASYLGWDLKSPVFRGAFGYLCFFGRCPWGRSVGRFGPFWAIPSYPGKVLLI